MQEFDVSFTIRSRRCSCSGAKYDLEWWNLSYEYERRMKFRTVSYRWCGAHYDGSGF